MSTDFTGIFARDEVQIILTYFADWTPDQATKALDVMEAHQPYARVAHAHIRASAVEVFERYIRRVGDNQFELAEKLTQEAA